MKEGKRERKEYRVRKGEVEYGGKEEERKKERERK